MLCNVLDHVVIVDEQGWKLRNIVVCMTPTWFSFRGHIHKAPQEKTEVKGKHWH